MFKHSNFLLLLLLALSILLLPQAEARPISFPGGVTPMLRHDWEMNRLHLHYTPHRLDSLGVAVEQIRQRDQTNLFFQWNHLLFRRNRERSQLNIYSMLESGVTRVKDEVEPALGYTLAGDWETRRYFTSYVAGFEHAAEFDNGSFHQIARLGFAPYLGSYGSLHSWLMIQFEHHPEEEESTRVGPVLRFFKREYLVELGVDNRRDLFFNLVARY